MAQLSVVIPVYQCEDCLQELYHRLKASLETITQDFEILLVEDCGGDRSWEVICEISKMDQRIKGIQLSRNYGQHNALLCGIRAAQGEIIVTMDDDLQHPPEEIPKLLDKLSEGYDVVYGTPKEEQHGFWRDFASRVTKLTLQSVMGAETARSVSALRAFRAYLRDAFAGYHGPYVSVDVLLTWGTRRFAAIPVRHDLRQIGVSHYTFFKLMTHALNMMTGFTVLPLQLASLIGFMFTLFGISIFGYVIGRYLLEGNPVRGFPFLASIIAIFSGAQLLALGIIGEYLSRMHFQTMGRPPYVIKARSEAAAED